MGKTETLMMILSRVTQIVPVNTEILTQMLGMSLAVQWLSLCALLQRAHIQFLVGELRSYMSCGTALPLKKKYKCSDSTAHTLNHEKLDIISISVHRGTPQVAQ